MKKQTNILIMIQWLVVLVALAVTSQLAQLTGPVHWLVTIAIGLGCLGLGDACSRLLKKEQHAMA